MVLSYLLEPNWGKHNLNRLALTYLQVKAISYNEVVMATGKAVWRKALPTRAGLKIL